MFETTGSENSLNVDRSPAYAVVRAALLERRCVRADYRGLPRIMCPHVIGLKREKEHALFFQFAGESGSGLPPGGEWRCLDLSGLSNISIYPGHWRQGLPKTRPQSCVDQIDVQVKP